MNMAVERQVAKIYIPRNMNDSALGVVLSRLVKATEAGNRYIVMDFSQLVFCDPVGVAALANYIAYFQSAGVEFKFRNHDVRSDANKYLDDAGFFEEFLGNRAFEDSGLRNTTIPFKCFDKNNYIGYLYERLAPWIAQEVNLSSDTMESIRACLEEVFHNIEFHSKAAKGFTIAQHYPKKSVIKIAITDFGIGIPTQVRSLLPELNDPDAIVKACEEGFTTKSNVKNRGVGLALLVKYVVARNGGTVDIRSGLGVVKIAKNAKGAHLNAMKSDWPYPGTMVNVTLRTDTLEELDSEVVPEVFKWW